jgi:hypothetical protein
MVLGCTCDCPEDGRKRKKFSYFLTDLYLLWVIYCLLLYTELKYAVWHNQYLCHISALSVFKELYFSDPSSTLWVRQKMWFIKIMIGVPQAWPQIIHLGQWFNLSETELFFYLFHMPVSHTLLNGSYLLHLSSPIQLYRIQPLPILEAKRMAIMRRVFTVFLPGCRWQLCFSAHGSWFLFLFWRQCLAILRSSFLLFLPELYYPSPGRDSFHKSHSKS